jgi:hypothetical protein
MELSFLADFGPGRGIGRAKSPIEESKRLPT